MNLLSKFCLSSVFFVTCCTLNLEAYFESDGSLENEPWTGNDEVRPFAIEVTGDAIGKAKFEEENFEGQSFKYSVVALEGGMGFYYDPCYKEAAGFTVGYNLVHLDWHNNPFFSQSHFHILRVALGGITERLANWTWKGQIAIDMDTDHFNISEYAYYDFFFWGRYTYSPCVNIHIGMLGETGMKIDHIYPIIGFDWRINDHWQLNVIYPVNISAQYLIDESWSVELATRFFDDRYRVGKSEPLSQGLVCYRTTGIELGVNYEYNDWLTANIHGGTTLRSNLKVATRHYNHREHLRLKPAGYFGGELEVKF